VDEGRKAWTGSGRLLVVEPRVLFAGVPVARFASSVAWYERLFGRPPDVVAHEREVMWRVAEGAWLYVLEDGGRAGTALVSMSVRDLERSVAELAGRGLEPVSVEDVGEAGRKACFADPEGNAVNLLEVS
jgi:predicted enzyme related to lactoylglutathione lyase